MTTKILVADDEAFMRRLIDASFKKGGFEIILASSGEQALALAAEHHPALIVMDLMMPGMDGLASLRALKNERSLRDIPVIMLTARGQKFTQLEATQSGAAAFMTKPFSPSRLVEEAQRLLLTEVPQ